jgi:hypothetical protein
MGLRIGHPMAEPVGQGHEIALGVDDRLLHPARTLRQQPAQRVRFARAAIALHQQAGGQQRIPDGHLPGFQTPMQSGMIGVQTTSPAGTP